MTGSAFKWLWTILLAADLFVLAALFSLFIVATPSVVFWQQQLAGATINREATAATLHYLTRDESFESSIGQVLLYTPAELEHLQATKSVFDRLKKIFLGSVWAGFILLAVSALFLRQTPQLLAAATQPGIILLLGLMVASLSSFDYLFARLHLTFFPQGGFLFPAGSLLPELFPEQFFRNAGLFIWLIAGLQLLGLRGLALWIRRRG